MSIGTTPPKPIRFRRSLKLCWGLGPGMTGPPIPIEEIAPEYRDIRRRELVRQRRFSCLSRAATAVRFPTVECAMPTDQCA